MYSNKGYLILCSWTGSWSTSACRSTPCKCCTATNQNIKFVSVPEGFPAPIPGGKKLSVTAIACLLNPAATEQAIVDRKGPSWSSRRISRLLIGQQHGGCSSMMPLASMSRLARAGSMAVSSLSKRTMELDLLCDAACREWSWPARMHMGHRLFSHNLVKLRQDDTNFSTTSSF